MQFGWLVGVNLVEPEHCVTPTHRFGLRTLPLRVPRRGFRITQEHCAGFTYGLDLPPDYWTGSSFWLVGLVLWVGYNYLATFERLDFGFVTVALDTACSWLLPDSFWVMPVVTTLRSQLFLRNTTTLVTQTGQRYATDPYTPITISRFRSIQTRRSPLRCRPFHLPRYPPLPFPQTLPRIALDGLQIPLTALHCRYRRWFTVYQTTVGRSDVVPSGAFDSIPITFVEPRTHLHSTVGLFVVTGGHSPGGQIPIAAARHV